MADEEKKDYLKGYLQGKNEVVYSLFWTVMFWSFARLGNWRKELILGSLSCYRGFVKYVVYNSFCFLNSRSQKQTSVQAVRERAQAQEE